MSEQQEGSASRWQQPVWGPITLAEAGVFVLAIAILCLGVVLAWTADVPLDLRSESEDQNLDARREIGGGLVAGAVLAIVVLIFEELREIGRESRAVVRDRKASIEAFRRELDLELISLVVLDGRLARANWSTTYLYMKIQIAQNGNHPNRRLPPLAKKIPLMEAMNRAGIVANLLDQKQLASRIVKARAKSYSVTTDPPPGKDPLAYWQEFLREEDALWLSLFDEMQAYQRARYPELGEVEPLDSEEVLRGLQDPT